MTNRAAYKLYQQALEQWQSGIIHGQQDALDGNDALKASTRHGPPRGVQDRGEVAYYEARKLTAAGERLSENYLPTNVWSWTLAEAQRPRWP